MTAKLADSNGEFATTGVRPTADGWACTYFGGVVVRMVTAAFAPVLR